MNARRLAVCVALIAAPTIVSAQPSVFRTRTYAPRALSTGSGSSSTVMQWDCGLNTTDTTRRYRLNDVVTRSEVISKTLTISRLDTIDSAELVELQRVPAKPQPVPAGLRGFEGNLYVDKDDPSILRVNPWLFTSDTIVYGSEPISRATFNGCQYFYKLENRTSLYFRSNAITVGATVIPFRIRPGYDADNGERIDTEVASQLGVGLYGGWTFGRTRYFYSKGGENTLRDVFRFTVGPFVAFASGSADSLSTRSASSPLPSGRKASFVTWSPGVTALVHMKGVDVGGFFAQERVLGSDDARKWDRNGRWWWGFGLGYQLFK